MNLTPAVRDLVLVGGGHSHVQVLKRFGMRPEPGVRLTLIAREVHTPYSGMLPGHVAGLYDWDDIHIDLAQLCRFAGARLVAEEVVGVDLDGRRLALASDRPPIRFDTLSINIGGTPGRDLEDADWLLPVKPIGRFLPRWRTLTARMEQGETLRLLFVGGGPGSVELAVATATRYGAKAQCVLVTADPDVLQQHNDSVRSIMKRRMTSLGVEIESNFEVTDVSDSRVTSSAGSSLQHDAVVWVTGVDAPAWPGQHGLETDGFGFVSVNRFLQSTSHPFVFASGDAAAMIDQPRPKSGVYAVRQGPVLADNLRRHTTGRSLRPFRAQGDALAILSMSDGRAVASRGGFHAAGRWVWNWKNWIDRRFMRRFQVLPVMVPDTPLLAPALRDSAPDPMRCGGCGAKLGADLLTRVLDRLPPQARPELLRGIGDDAAVVRLETSTMATSVDGFRAMIDDPYTFGRITAHHALNDLFAMGADATLALALVTVPLMADELMEDELYQVMSGALEVLNDHGAVLAGGHSAEGAELSLGFAVTGTLTDDPLAKGGLRIGQHLLMTKPIGTGVLLAGVMQGKTRGEDLMRTIEAMDTSNQAAADILRRHGASACTDVTGFGLAGHLTEMTRASAVGAILRVDAVPLLDSAAALMSDGVQSSLQENNEQALSDFEIAPSVRARVETRLLADPQTAGGLLAGIPADGVEACLAELRDCGYRQASDIGVISDDDRLVIESN